jgi:hypothetical protein
MARKRKSPGALAGAAEAETETAKFHSEYSESPRYCKPVPLGVVVVDLLDKIERAWLCNEPLHLDGIDLLQLHDNHLPLWLGDVRRIIADSDLAGRWIRDRMKGEGVRIPEIRVGGGHD